MKLPQILSAILLLTATSAYCQSTPDIDPPSGSYTPAAPSTPPATTAAQKALFQQAAQLFTALQANGSITSNSLASVKLDLVQGGGAGYNITFTFSSEGGKTSTLACSTFYSAASDDKEPDFTTATCQ